MKTRGHKRSIVLEHQIMFVHPLRLPLYDGTLSRLHLEPRRRTRDNNNNNTPNLYTNMGLLPPSAPLHSSCRATELDNMTVHEYEYEHEQVRRTSTTTAG